MEVPHILAGYLGFCIAPGASQPDGWPFAVQVSWDLLVPSARTQLPLPPAGPGPCFYSPYVNSILKKISLIWTRYPHPVSPQFSQEWS